MTLWYVGDPCYAINEETWQNFCDILSNYNHAALEGDGVQFSWNWIDNKCRTRVSDDDAECACGCEEYFADCPQDKTGTSRVYVYNSGLGGDGSINLGNHRLGVDAGLLSVLPLEVCHRLTDAEKTEGEHGCHSIIDSHYRPVFDITTDEFPHVTLEYTESVFNPQTGFIERGKTITLNDTSDHTECDVCGEWENDCNMMYNNHQGAACYACYEEEEEEEEGEDL